MKRKSMAAGCLLKQKNNNLKEKNVLYEIVITNVNQHLNGFFSF